MQDLARELKENIEKEVEDLLLEFAQDSINLFHAEMTLKKINVTRQLYQSFSRTLIKNSQQMRYTLTIFYAEHGSFRDMAYRKYKKAANVDALAKWVEDRGIDKFKTIPGYTKGRRPPLANDRLAKRIAWAIAISYVKKNKVVRRKGGWQNKKAWSKKFSKLALDITNVYAKITTDFIGAYISN
jgi:hypothetical protein